MIYGSQCFLLADRGNPLLNRSLVGGLQFVEIRMLLVHLVPYGEN